MKGKKTVQAHLTLINNKIRYKKTLISRAVYFVKENILY